MTKQQIYDQTVGMTGYKANQFILETLEKHLNIPTDNGKSLPHRTYTIGQLLGVSLYHIPDLTAKLDYLLDCVFPGEPSTHELSELVEEYNIIPGHTLDLAIHGLSEKFKISLDTTLTVTMKIKLLKAIAKVYEGGEQP